MQRDGSLPAHWRCAGYDHAPRLLDAARRRGMPRAQFHRIDLGDMWTAHLGFDHHVVRRHIRQKYLDTERWRLERVRSSMGGSNHFLVLNRQR